MVTIESTAFANNDSIPKKYSREGRDVSPPLKWSGVPSETKSFALICEDPDAPSSKPWVHWLLFNIPADRNGLGEGDSAGAIEGMNDFSERGYGGPMPPEGDGPHHYHFELYALDSRIEIEPNATRDELHQAMEPHILASGELIGTYQR